MQTNPYTIYSEAGGVGKTTFAANLATAHHRDGDRVLAVDLDPQDGGLSYLLGVDDDRTDPNADNLVRHMITRPRGDFEDLIQTTAEGVDVLPSHQEYTELPGYLRSLCDLDDDVDPNAQLRRVLMEHDVPERYDVIVVDPPATEAAHLYNALDATRNLVIPVELSGKGQQSVSGLRDLVEGLEDQLGIDVGVLAAVPNRYEGTNDQDAILDELRAGEYPVPVVIRKRGSLFEGCWRQQCSAYRYVEEHRDRQRDYEMETLDQLTDLARFISNQ